MCLIDLTDVSDGLKSRSRRDEESRNCEQKTDSGVDHSRHRFGFVPGRTFLAKLSFSCRACFDLMVITLWGYLHAADMTLCAPRLDLDHVSTRVGLTSRRVDVKHPTPYSLHQMSVQSLKLRCVLRKQWRLLISIVPPVQVQPIHVAVKKACPVALVRIATTRDLDHYSSNQSRYRTTSLTMFACCFTART